jgi:hypothetical protein
MGSQFSSQSVPHGAATPLAEIVTQATELYGIESQRGFDAQWQSAPNGTAVFTLAFDNSPLPATKIEGEGGQREISAVDWAQIDRLAIDGTPGQAITKQQLRTLKRYYASISEDGLIMEALGEVPALYLLLKEAVGPLRAAFGDEALLQLEALETDEEGTILRVVVHLPSATDAPAERMRGFKRDWWFQRCSLSQASLVFDYERANGL